MQRLCIYQAIWAMESMGMDLDGGMDAVLDRIQEAGFDGVGVGLYRAERAAAVARGADARRMSWEAICFVRTPEDLAVRINEAQTLGAHHLNVQIVERFERLEPAIDFLQRLQVHSSRAQIPVYYETHRGRLTNDLLFMMAVLDALPDLRLTADLSHYVVAHEMLLPVAEADLARMTRIIDKSWNFHGRVAGSHQVQIPVAAPQHQGWVEQFSRWWLEGFRSWLRRAPAESQLCFMCELGPPNYAITDALGRELSDRWQDSLILKDLARRLWAQATG